VNSRLDAIQAAILRVKLPYLDEWTEDRRRNAGRYRELVSQFGLDSRIGTPLEPAGYKHVYNQFTIRTKQRDDLREFLRSNGIPTEVYYPFPLHLQPAFAGLGYKPGSMPNSEAVSVEVLALPIFPELSSEQQESVMSSISEFFER
jgi:dTDP-4-amino-4,6-dideoxygalactose transaminase